MASVDAQGRAQAEDSVIARRQFAQADALRRAGQDAEAVERYGTVLRLDPAHSAAHINRGVSLTRLARHEEAAEAFTQAIALRGPEPGLLLNLTDAFYRLERLEEALAAAQRACELAPQLAEARFLRGKVRRALGYIEAADAAYAEALAIEPEHIEVLASVAHLRQEQGRLEESLTLYDRVLSIDPAHREARFNKALVLLHLGRFAEGWDAYEYRWQSTSSKARPGLALPEWNGESLSGKTLLVYGEQGIGDNIMFATCLTQVVASAARVVVIINERLAGLVQRAFPTAMVIGQPPGTQINSAATLPGCDFQIAIGSLPRLLRRDDDAFPRAERTLIADPSQRQLWQRRYASLGPAPKVGICWKAGPSVNERRLRTVPLSLWDALLKTRGVTFVSLQMGEVAADLEAAQRRTGTRVYHFDDVAPRGDLDPLAAQISALDLVICPQNTTVHLAGALGVPCWVLLPQAWVWRWPLGETEARWYRSLRLFRQTQQGDWTPVVEALAKRLADWSGQ